MSVLATDLEEARTAWRVKRDAERNLARLRRYKAMTASMKRDRDHDSQRLEKAEQTLDRLLGGAA